MRDFHFSLRNNNKNQACKILMMDLNLLKVITTYYKHSQQLKLRTLNSWLKRKETLSKNGFE